MVLTTLHPKLEIDGRPISRLLSILTPLKSSSSSSSVCPALSPPATPAGWQTSSSFILGVTKLSWAGAGAGLGQGLLEKWLAPCVSGSRQGCKHLLRPPSDRHLISHGEGDGWDYQKTNTHTERGRERTCYVILTSGFQPDA